MKIKSTFILASVLSLSLLGNTNVSATVADSPYPVTNLSDL